MLQSESIPRGLTVREVAESQGLTESATRRSVNQGLIPSYKVGGARRIPASYLEELQRCGSLAAHVDALVASWPALSDEQMERIAALLRSSLAG